MHTLEKVALAAGIVLFFGSGLALYMMSGAAPLAAYATVQVASSK